MAVKQSLMRKYHIRELKGLDRFESNNTLSFIEARLPEENCLYSHVLYLQTYYIRLRVEYTLFVTVQIGTLL